VLYFKWGKRLKLTECPKCKEPQKLLTLLLINNMTNKKCHKCGCVLKYDSGKSALLLVSIIFPVFILEQFKDSLGDWYIALLVIGFFIGIYSYVTKIPLVQKNKT
jgi:hypothetical protein